MKRIITFMMALALVLSLGITAFAEGGAGAGSITITNATAGETYKVYKIFDATYNTSGDVTYTITDDNQFFTKLFGTGALDTADHETDYFVYHASTGVVTRKTDSTGTPIKTDGQLFDYLATLLTGASPVQTKNATGTTVEFTGLDTGYFVIDRTNGSANGVTITTAKPHADVHDKNLLPGGDLDKKADKDTNNDDKFTAAVGDTINWEVTFTATNYDNGEKVLSYTIKDTLSPTDWAEINTGSIKIYVDGAEITAWNLVSGSASGFEILIPWANADGTFKYPASANVKITYSATVKDAAADENPATQVNKNTAELDWSCNTDTDKPKDETEAEVYNMGFTKVDGTDATKTLSGAVFALYSDSACTVPVNVKIVSEGVYMVDKTSTSNSVITPANGQVVIQGLDVGKYYLKETTAPDGYNLLTNATEVEVKADAGDEITYGEGAGAVTYYVNNAELNIANNSGVELPSTGGKGTIMMITIGTLVAMAFAVLLITQKKMSIYKD